MKRILAKPYVVCGSDSSIFTRTKTGGHPRSFGSFPLFFRTASQSCPYAEVIRRMTSLPAAKFNIRGRSVTIRNQERNRISLATENEFTARHFH